jgi:hypothetical protein
MNKLNNLLAFFFCWLSRPCVARFQLIRYVLDGSRFDIFIDNAFMTFSNTVCCMQTLKYNTKYKDISDITLYRIVDHKVVLKLYLRM